MKYLQQAIEKWDGDDQDLAQVFTRPYSLKPIAFLSYISNTP